jgi:hypothetical protein
LYYPKSHVAATFRLALTKERVAMLSFAELFSANSACPERLLRRALFLSALCVKSFSFLQAEKQKRRETPSRHHSLTDY